MTTGWSDFVYGHGKKDGVRVEADGTRMFRCCLCKEWMKADGFHARNSKAKRVSRPVSRRCKECDKTVHEDAIKRNGYYSPTKRRAAFDAYNAGSDELPEKYLRSELKRKLTGAVFRSKKAGSKCDITIDDLVVMFRKQKGLCLISDARMKLGMETRTAMGVEGRDPEALSIDRIDSARGYELDNMRLVTYIVNIAMNNWGQQPLFRLSLAVASKLENGSLKLEPTRGSALANNSHLAPQLTRKP
jgi:hypothetical protein